jgi:hypothetical protein
MMTFVYESKNKEVKSYAYVTNQRINIAQSLMYKAAMRFNSFLLEHADGFLPTTFHEKANIKKLQEIGEEDWFTKLSQQSQTELITSTGDDELLLCEEIIHKGSSYKIGYHIIDNQYEPQNVLLIRNIAFAGNKYYFAVERIPIIAYEQHFCSYEIGSNSDVNEIIKVENIRSLPSDIHQTNNGKKYFKLKHI